MNTSSRYPRDISGNITFTEDTELGIPAIEIDYIMDRDGKGNRKVNNVSARIPDRVLSRNSNSQVFDNGTIFIDYDPENNIQSITMYSLNSVLDRTTMTQTQQASEFENYLGEKKDIELLIMYQTCLQVWGNLEDLIPIFNACGIMSEVAIRKDNGEEMEIPEDVFNVLDIEDIELDSTDDDEDDAC